MASNKRLTGPMSRRLRTARVDAGLTQQDIATRTGLGLKTVYNYENQSYGRARKYVAVQAWATECGRECEEIWGPRDQPYTRTGWFGGSRESDRWVA